MTRLATPDRIAGCVTDATATPGIANIANEGCTITAHAGAGVWAVTLDNPIDATECVCVAVARGAVPFVMSVEQTSDTVKTVHAATGAGVATDVGWDLAIFRVR